MNWSAINWMAISAVSSAATGIVILASVVYLAIQVHSARRAMQFQAFLALTNKLIDEDEARARGKVILCHSKPIDNWSQEERGWAERVCRTYDFAGQVVKHKFLREEIVLDEWGDSLRRCWTVLRPFVKIASDRAVDFPAYDDFQRLGESALRRFGEPKWDSPPTLEQPDSSRF